MEEHAETGEWDILVPEHSQAAVDPLRKRHRIRFSCTTCREKKLKCNRVIPCDQCHKRGITASCRYVPYGPSRAGMIPTIPNSTPSSASPISSSGLTGSLGPKDSALHSRLRHLEHIVQVLKAQRKEATELGDRETLTQRSSESTEVEDGWSEDQAEIKEECQEDLDALSPCLKKSVGRIVRDLRYVDPANWEAVLDDISKLTTDLCTTDDTEDEEEPPNLPVDLANTQRPLLLLGPFPPATVPELLTLLPPRDATDRIIARFFQAKEPAWIVFHVPTFLKQYEKFWENPGQATLSWLALLFGMISHAASICLRSGEEMMGIVGQPQEILDTYRIRAAHCLALDDYTKPAKYKMEALILYFGTEYVHQPDAKIGVSILLSVFMRLAMHMGLHRDPKHYPNMKPFETEMRRRLWAVLWEVDILVSFQFGLPANMQPMFYDTEPPRNLYDEDFDESTTELPPSQPETVRTKTLYTVVKHRLVSVFADICRAVAAPDSPTYHDIKKLDARLTAVRESFPAILHHRSFSQSVADPNDLIFQRYWLDLLYQKARIVLHRRYLGVARIQPARYGPSRWACLDAAMRVLQHQRDIHRELQPGGRLGRERWFRSSLSTHDFLLADMILCLEVTYLRTRERNLRGFSHALDMLADERTVAVVPMAQLLACLRASRAIWETMRRDSAEAIRAYRILTKMLELSTGPEDETGSDSRGGGGSSAEAEGINATSTQGFNCIGTPSADVMPPMQPPDSTGSSTSISPAPPMWWEYQYPFIPNWAADPPHGGGGGGLNGSTPSDTPVTVDLSDGFMDPSLISTDWSMWDNHVQNSSADMTQIPWETFFQAGRPGL